MKVRPSPRTTVWMCDTGEPAVVQIYDVTSAAGTFPVKRASGPGWEISVPEAVSETPLPQAVETPIPEQPVRNKRR
jgi:nitrogen fixation protein